MYIFTPLYIANYCQNYCIYCGFNCYNNIRRKRLTFEEIEHEMQVIARTGMEEILILTGESRAYSDVKYIGEAVKIAKKYFKNIGIEIYPVNVDEYQYLHECGVDYVTSFSRKLIILTNTKRFILWDINVSGRIASIHRNVR